MNNSILIDKVVIYSFPRAGTKLLSSIFCQFGYHECGEWFDTYSSTIQDDRITRLSPDRIAAIQDFSKTQPNPARYFHIKKTMDRLSDFPDNQKQIVTLWHENIENCPFIINELDQALWLLPVRNKWDQLISFMISHDNQNFNHADINKPVIIPEWLFRLCYWKLQRVTRTQEWISANLNSITVPFNELISGTFTGFDRPYAITTVDENKDIESLVLNMDDVKSWYAQLETSCQHIDTLQF